MVGAIGHTSNQQKMWTYLALGYFLLLLRGHYLNKLGLDENCERTGGFVFVFQDQFDNLEKHTSWGIDFLERYTKFIKERADIELSYAKQIRYLSYRLHATPCCAELCNET